MVLDPRLTELERENAALRHELSELRRSSQPPARVLDDVIHRLLSDRSLLEHLPDIITVMDREHRILYLNRTIPGRSVEEMVGSSALLSIPADHHERFCALFERVWQSGEPCSFEVPTVSDMWWDSRFVPVRRRGETVCMLATSYDATQRRRAEHAERESEGQLRLALDATGMGTWTWREQSDQLSWDDITCEIFGVSRSQLPRSLRDYVALVHPDDRSEVKAALKRCRDSGIYDVLEHRVMRPDGQVRHVFSKGTLIRDEEGRFVGFRGGVIDISARKRLEEQLNQVQKMEAIGQLTAGIAHNFNNLLSVILPNVALARSSAGSDLSSCLEDIEHASQRAADLVQQLLLFARPDCGAQLQQMDLAASINRTIQICRTTFDRAIRIELSLPPDLPKIEGHPGQIEQVLLNICLNARDALEEARSAVEPLIRLRAGVSDDGSVSIRISDNGPGMDECTRRRVFEPFFTTKEVGRGTGLGLASAYAIVSEHRGRIHCESALGVGTTFQLELPAARAGQLSAIAPASLPLPAANETVLLIDDEPMVRRAASAMLSYGGYRVLEAEDGRDAIAQFEQARSEIDLIILDRSMPGLSGEQVAQRLQQIDPRVPIVLLSGQSGYSQTRVAAAAALPKPVDADVLLRTLREVIDRSRAVPPES